ncbi:MAG TPA: isoprenylcysteine carboxylmethyltransferase family protein [Rhodothermales bacterium]|nr:isoprenylcysteine carboxylmethyltransferase family protein [Rhodothermales bacterium]
MKTNVAKIVSGSFLLLRSLFWTMLLPGTVTLYIPYLIVTRWYPTMLGPWNVVQLLSLIPIVLGAAILLHCIWGFAVIGRATLSPLDAPRHLVVQGLYRYVRNPMYVGVLMILIGEALLFISVPLIVYAMGFFALVNLFIIFYEEPTLRRQFGASYERYCHAVGRWLPGRPFNEADGAAEADL